MMESLLEKLKLLEYEHTYCNPNRIKGFSKLHFAIPTNPGEQFNSFVSLSAWLIGQSGHYIEQPQEHDDPNATIATILDSLRTLTGQTPDFPPSKLKSGCGEYCIQVLDLLADTAVKNRNLNYDPPQIEQDDEESLSDRLNIVDRSSQNDDLVEWTVNKAGILPEVRVGICDSEVEAEIEETGDELRPMDLKYLDKSQTNVNEVHGENINSEDPCFVDPHGPFGGLLMGTASYYRSRGGSEGTPDSFSVEPGEWQMEVERVLPQLRIVSRPETKDWRGHLDQVNNHRKEIDSCFKDSRSHLQRLQEDLSRGLDKINSREKYINTQIDQILAEYRCVQDRLCRMKERYNQASGGITKRSKVLTELSDELERVKQEMDQRGSSMTDSSPVVRIKQAIQRLKAENVAMEIRIGVLEHTLLRMHLRAREESQKPLFMHPYPLEEAGGRLLASGSKGGDNKVSY
uniref:Intraflagellar transport protein 57 homolog n=1 Tax=Mesocestoides corti TaxID=53468 RepID=A0A5K3FNK8_MESCO